MPSFRTQQFVKMKMFVVYFFLFVLFVLWNKYPATMLEILSKASSFNFNLQKFSLILLCCAGCRERLHFLASCRKQLQVNELRLLRQRIHGNADSFFWFLYSKLIALQLRTLDCLGRKREVLLMICKFTLKLLASLRTHTTHILEYVCLLFSYLNLLWVKIMKFNLSASI